MDEPEVNDRTTSRTFWLNVNRCAPIRLWTSPSQSSSDSEMAIRTNPASLPSMNATTSYSITPSRVSPTKLGP